MSRTSRRRLCLGIAALGLAGCAHRIVEQGQQYPIPANAQALPPERLEQLIREATSTRGWKVERVSAGRLVCTLTRRSYSVWTEVHFTQTGYSFTFERNAELARKGPEVPSEYSRWIYYMKSDIDARLQGARA